MQRMKRHGIREMVAKRQVKLTDDEAKAEIQKFHDHLQSVLVTGQVKWICNTDQIPSTGGRVKCRTECHF